MSTERYVVFSYEPDIEGTHHDLVDVPLEEPDRAAAAMSRAMAHRLGRGQNALPVVAWRVDQLRQACEEWTRSQQALQVEGPALHEPPSAAEGRKFFKTTFECEVLAEGEPFQLRTLADLAYQCGDGPCSGLERNLQVEEVPAAEFERLCLEHGTDIEFFLEEDTLAKAMGAGAPAPPCPSRHDPEGEHEAGYRCTLPDGHPGDHQAHGTTPGAPVYGWGAMEGLAAPPDQGRQR